MLEGTVRDDEQQPIRHAAVTVMDTRGRQLVRHPVVHQKLMQSGVAVRADFTLHGRTRWTSSPVPAQH
ncbi:hypothetical protein [Streptomyces sp. NRRL WC-3744]|uniref:hypothetical protein n=1 Tax=Streptomyces sp. NRRL WC-3744 TaxID=1463935 RepID=UPI0004C9AACB|nr:hypothetical protein [Streptomyces sp. NRRL WC-3744]